MNIRFYTLILFISSAFLLGCRKDYDNNDEMKIEKDATVYINTSITGIVKDEANQPLKDVIITLDQNIVKTDNNGFFYLKDIQARLNGALITASLNGYTSTSSIVYPKLNDILFIKLTLILEKIQGDINGLNGGTLVFDHGIEINVSAESTLDENGNSYTDQIKIKGHWLNPTDVQLSNNQIGIQIGLSEKGDRKVLQSFGVVNINFSDNNDNPLSFIESNAALIKFYVPDEMKNIATAQIQLWKFSNISNQWIYQSIAPLENGQYNAQVTSSGWYNVAIGYDPILIESKMISEDDEGLAYSSFDLIANNNDFKVNMISNNQGVIKAYVPIDESYTISIRNCDNKIAASVETAVLKADKNLGDLKIIGLNEIVHFEAKLLNCNDSIVDQGYIQFGNDPKSYFPVEENGIINITSYLCSANHIIDYVGFDYQNGTKGSVSDIEIERTFEIGDVYTCLDNRGFIRIDRNKVIDEASNATLTEDELNGNLVFKITGDFDQMNTEFAFHILIEKDYKLGNQNAVGFLYFDKKDSLELTLTTDNIIDDRILLNITKIPAKKGDYIEGEFSGRFIHNKEDYPLDGAFKARFD